MSAELVFTRRDDAIVHVVLNRAGVDVTSLEGDVGDAPPAPFRVLVGGMQALLSRLEAVEKPVALAERRTPTFTGR